MSFGNPEENGPEVLGTWQPGPEVQAPDMGVLVSSYQSAGAAPGVGSDFANRPTLMSGIGAGLWGALAAAVLSDVMGALREAAAATVGLDWGQCAASSSLDVASRTRQGDA